MVRGFQSDPWVFRDDSGSPKGFRNIPKNFIGSEFVSEVFQEVSGALHKTLGVSGVPRECSKGLRRLQGIPGAFKRYLKEFNGQCFKSKALFPERSEFFPVRSALFNPKR